MKNLYIYLMAIGLAFSAHSQNLQNANWYLGNNSGLTFLPNPLMPAGLVTALQSDEACASVSDQEGNLLFYSNGVSVYNKNNTLMTNGSGLLGNTSMTQGVAIVPRPGTENFYIITIAITSTHGLYYSEIDMSLSSDLGAVLAANKNTVLSDHNGVPSSNYTIQLSERMTTTRHSNNVDYWLITQVGDFIYSYLVTNAGISSMPVSYTPATMPTSFETSDELGQIKISPNGQRVAIAYNNLIDTEEQYGAIVLGNFNSTTGQIVLDSNRLTNGFGTGYNMYGLEFSPGSKYIYYGIEGDIYRGDAYYGTDAGVIKVSSNTPVIFDRGAFQLAINGKIYICNPSTSSTTLAVIHDPDNSLNPNVQDFAVQVPPNGRNGLPAWVHYQKGNCDPNIVLSNPESHLLPYTYAYASFITTQGNYGIAPGQNIKMKAGDYVLLKPNTHIKGGSIYLAEIEYCESLSALTAQETAMAAKQDTNTITVQENGITINPNPASNIAAVDFNGNSIIHLSVTAIDSRILFAATVKNTQESLTIDVSNYPKGIYLITAQTALGKILTAKLIKN